MFRHITAVALVAATALVLTIEPAMAEETKAAFETQKETISYSLGYSIANNLKREYDFDLDALVKGLRDNVGGTPVLSEAEIKTAMASFQQEVQMKKMAEMQAASQKNKAEGEAFLAANKGKEGVVTLDSGLQYKVITMGEGTKPAETDTVQCHYRGTTIDGAEFDSSYKRGEPASFPVNGVIAGWTEALQLMPVGSKWMLYVPSDLAYGDRGAGGAIEPGETLIFEVELIDIES